ncbi:unnamed protein product [Heligmosomoides polygyrus]|uniref:UBIQUITIN_CONJUGAT_2 domain-containing protein n=1 Tax=Heligmosomoides polygyrus TaxID=6339 RepID=A0A183F9S5_HELPZ|nr:unnamed protein product [Heligmosomoides polygyrus]
MIEILNDSLSEIKGQIRGPPDTPYQGGSFDLEIKIPDTYPFTPPKVSSLTLPLYNKLRCHRHQENETGHTDSKENKQIMLHSCVLCSPKVSCSRGGEHTELGRGRDSRMWLE